MKIRTDRQLAQLNRELTEMGALCEDAIAAAGKALMEDDRELAKKVAPIERDIDRKERAIETLCLNLLLKQQPEAEELRQISAALKMITDMERIGDQARDVSELVDYVAKCKSECASVLGRMTQATIQMVNDSVEAFVRRDVELAKKVIAADDVVDECFNSVKTSLIGEIAKNAKDGESLLDVMMIAKYFERIGDHAVNIAEWVIFSITGLHKGETKPATLGAEE